MAKAERVRPVVMAVAADSCSIWRRVRVGLLVCLGIEGILDQLFRFRTIDVKFIEKKHPGDKRTIVRVSRCRGFFASATLLERAVREKYL